MRGAGLRPLAGGRAALALVLAFAMLLATPATAQGEAQAAGDGGAAAVPQGALGGAADGRASEQAAGIRSLFSRLDANQDGQVDASETARYAGSAFDFGGEEGWSVAVAAARSQAALDGADAGGTVSQSELAAHLRVLLQVRALGMAAGCCPPAAGLAQLGCLAWALRGPGLCRLASCAPLPATLCSTHLLCRTTCAAGPQGDRVGVARPQPAAVCPCL